MTENNTQMPIPAIKDQLPLNDERPELFRLNALPMTMHFTPGFAYFVNSFTDDMLLSYMNVEGIDKYPKISSNYRYLFIIRTVWLQRLNDEARRKWEVSECAKNYKGLSENKPADIDVLLAREIENCQYQSSKAHSDFRERAHSFEAFIKENDGIYQSTTKLHIDVNYSESSTSQHALQLLKVFLNLERFAQVLIEVDHEKALLLLGQMVNYSPNQPRGFVINLLQKLLPRSSDTEIETIFDLVANYKPSSSSSTDVINYKVLAFYPLFILEKVLSEFSPDHVGLERANQFRDEMLELGVVDFILECLAHFTHQSSRFLRLRSKNMVLPKYTVSFSSRRESNTNKGECVEEIDSDFFSYDDSDYPPTKMKQKPISSAGFSKGTGYGNGSIKTKWNMVDHLEKLRYDDNNIACLLKILRAYILPEKTVKPNLPKTSDLSPQSQCETKPTSSGHRAPKKARLSESDESIENIQSEIYEACSTSTHKTSNNISDENLMQPSMNVDFVKLLYRSCLRNTLHSYIRTDSLIEIHKNFETFRSAFQLIASLSKVFVELEFFKFVGRQELELRIEKALENDKWTELEENLDCHLVGDGKSDSCYTGATLFDLTFSDEGTLERAKVIGFMNKLSDNIEDYLLRIMGKDGNSIKKNSPESEKSFSMQFSKWLKGINENPSSTPNNHNDDQMVEETQIKDLCDICRRVTSLLCRNEPIGKSEIVKTVNIVPSSSASKDQVCLVNSKTYMEWLKDLQFASISSKDMPFYFTSQINTTSISFTNSRAKRIAKEIFSLRSSLMLSTSSSAFVRCFEENMESMKFLITGPEGTPYENGCFLFDLYLHSNFPTEPPKVQLLTTGGGTVRFNPNLYHDGKVCLSILGTWQGRPEENWNAETSTLLQIINSIQSLIFVEHPYFNEPGYEASMGTARGNQASEQYNETIRAETVRCAMLEYLTSPPKPFEDVIKRHFFLKKDEICAQIQRWMSHTKQPNLSKSFGKLKGALEKLKM